MRRTAAGRLLDELVHCGSHTLADVASWIDVDEPTLRECRDGRIALPVERQLALAHAVLRHAPAHARLAHSLRGQAAAATDFRMQTTERHMSAPPSKHW